MLNTNSEATQTIPSKNINTPLEVALHQTLKNPSLLSSDGLPTQTPPSVSTSEGGGGIYSYPNKDDRIKQTVETTIPTNMELYPALYSTKITRQRNQQTPSLFKRITLDRFFLIEQTILMPNQPISELIEQ